MKYSLIVVLSIILSPCFGQQVNLVNQSTHEAIENVAVFNQDKSKTGLSDQSGIVQLNVFNNTDSLYFQHTSFVKFACTYSEAIEMGTVELTRRVVIMPEFIITASKYKETQREIPHMADVISPRELELSVANTSADLLTSTGNIFVQKSQGGGGSPVLRGFEANKILLVIDGVRMNNAIYRGGHLQNSITLDNSILEKTEIVYGPNAIMYGSDALGGVIHYLTRNPELASDDGKTVFHANATTQVASADGSWKKHLDFSIGRKKFGSLTSISHADYGDVRMGSRRDPFIGEFGKCYFHVEQFGGVDSMVTNNNPLIQKNTGYSQLDILQKFRYKPTSRLEVIGNFQYSTSSEIPRYDMLNDTAENGKPDFAKWSYGPQQRILGSIKTSYSTNNFFTDNITAIAAYQYIEESRIKRKFRNADETTQQEQLDIYSLSIDLGKRINTKNRVIYGFETHYNEVDSRASLVNIETGQVSNATTRYPDEGSSTASYAAYVSLRGKLAPKWKYELGTRYNYTTLKANYSDSLVNISIKSLDIKNSAYTGSAGIIYLPSESSKLNLLVSTGYRIPNLDDIAKIRAKGDKITLPNPEVKPEYTYNAELGVSKTFNGYLQINLNYFASYLVNVIVRVPYNAGSVNDGSNSDNDNVIIAADRLNTEENVVVTFDGNEFLEVYQNDNSDRGIIHGLSSNIVSDFNSNISFNATLNYTYGRDITNDNPLAHIPPVFGRTEILYKAKKFTQGISFIYSGWKRIEDIALTGEDNEEEGTEHGFPGWYTINLKTNYNISKNVSVLFAVENVMDNFYKPFATAIAAPGINFIGTLRFKI